MNRITDSHQISQGHSVYRGCLDRRAFTLIELLIVVAIIAILAAIAVPNFLEAQVRAKVSRVTADLRTLGQGIEMYRTDNGAYMPYGSWGGHTNPRYFNALSTPVAYIGSAGGVIDPFRLKGVEDTDKVLEPRYGYFNPHHSAVKWIQQQSPRPAHKGQLLPGNYLYGLVSLGPDNKQGLETHDYKEYDPSNGTKSFGDIFRYGP